MNSINQNGIVASSCKDIDLFEKKTTAQHGQPPLVRFKKIPHIRYKIYFYGNVHSVSVRQLGFNYFYGNVPHGNE